MRTILALIVLATVVLSLVAVLLWPTLWSQSANWEKVFTFAVDGLGVLWFAALIALAISSFRRKQKALPAPQDEPRPGLTLVE